MLRPMPRMKRFLLRVALLACMRGGIAAGQESSTPPAPGYSSTQGPLDTGAGAAVNAPPEHQNWLLHAQGTEVLQGQPGFHSPYSGPQSFPAGDHIRQTSSVDIFLGFRPWQSAEIYVDPQYYQGYGFGNVRGVAAFPNGEAYQAGTAVGNSFFAHLYFKQTFGFGGEQELITGGPLQLAGKQDISRLTITAGRLQVGDQFDANAYAHDPTTQFLNWALIDNPAFDYAADLLGTIEGVTLEYNQKQYALRYGAFDVPRNSTGDRDFHLSEAWQQVAEFEERFTFFGHPGKARLLGWVERAKSGSYEETTANPSLMGDISATRRYRCQYGLGLNIEQELASGVGAFLRLGYRDGHSEARQFTDVDRHFSAGISASGERWNRKDDTLAIACVVDGLGQPLRDYLAAGGLGNVVGDGKLPHYDPECALETYYDWLVAKGAHLAVDYQLIANPGYNSDRGPISVFSARIHLAF